MSFPIRAVHQIEMTSRCNLRCAYCPSYRLPRPKVDMPIETFSVALEIASYLHKQWGWHELNLAGIGESTLHPNFVSFVLMARQVMGPNVNLVIATNGLLMTNEMAEAIRPARPSVFVSLHRPEKANRAIIALKRAGIFAGASCDGAIESVNWAGQIDWPVTTSARGAECNWVDKGKVIVLADGRVSRCSFDASGVGVICTLDDLRKWVFGISARPQRTSPYSLCDACHLRHPDRVLQQEQQSA